MNPAFSSKSLQTSEHFCGEKYGGPRAYRRLCWGGAEHVFNYYAQNKALEARKNVGRVSQVENFKRLCCKMAIVPESLGKYRNASVCCFYSAHYT